MSIYSICQNCGSGGGSSGGGGSMCNYLAESVTLCLIISLRVPSGWGPRSRPQGLRVGGPTHLQMSGKEVFEDFDDPEPSNAKLLRTSKSAGFKTRIVRAIPPRLGASASGEASRGAGGARGAGEQRASCDSTATAAAAEAPTPVASAAPAASCKDARKECTRIATFMFKGGVYKTTTTIHAASALAAPPFNKRVLIVDGDSQCNSTSFFMPEPKNWQDEQKLDERDSQKAGVGTGHVGGASIASNSQISLSEKGVSCPKKDPMTKGFFKNDTWLTDSNGEKILTIYDLLIPDFDQGRGSSEMPDPPLLPVTHFQKKDLLEGLVVCQCCDKTKAKADLDRNRDDWILDRNENEWFCGNHCLDNRMRQHTLFLLPGSTALSSLESRMSEDSTTIYR